MTDRSIQEMRASYSEEATSILNGYHKEIDAIRDTSRIDDGAYLDRLTPEQTRALLREQKVERAGEARLRALEAYRRATEQHYGEVVERRGFLKERLFSVPGAEGAAALARTVTASEEDLSALLDASLQAGNEDLARAVFVAAERRGSGDLMGRYFDELDPDGRSFYEEWRATPTGEQLERQLAGVDAIVAPADPDGLMPPPRVG